MLETEHILKPGLNKLMMIKYHTYKSITKNIRLFPFPNVAIMDFERFLEQGEHFMFLGEYEENNAEDYINLKILHRFGISYIFCLKSNIPLFFEEIKNDSK